MEPKRHARSVWFAITVFFTMLVVRCWQLANTDPYPAGYHGVRCGMGCLGFLFGMVLFGMLALIALVAFATRKP